jgi:hypothetical protein
MTKNAPLSSQRARRQMSPATLVGRLNIEWDTLRESSEANAHVACWANEDPQLAGLETLPLIEAATAGPVDLYIDGILFALVRRAIEHHQEAELAARIVLQLMLPKAILIAQNNARALRDADERIQLAICSLYEVIRTFPVDRVRRYVPAYLAWQTHALVHQAVLDQTREIADDTLGERLATTEELHPSEELEHLLAQAVRQEVISREDAELLAARYSGDSDSDKPTWKNLAAPAQLGDALGLSPDAVKKRCSRARRKLSESLTQGAFDPGGEV